MLRTAFGFASSLLKNHTLSGFAIAAKLSMWKHLDHVAKDYVFSDLSDLCRIKIANFIQDVAAMFFASHFLVAFLKLLLFFLKILL